VQAFLRAGDLFGEMSCLNRSPRSATIIAARECYVLEMLRNIFEKVKEDQNYKKKVEEEYKRRSLDQQLRNLPLFASLTEAQVERVRQLAELRSYKAGQIICDEYDRSDSMFIVRSGLGKVLRGASARRTSDDVADGPALLGGLKAAGAPDPAAGKLWQTFPEATKGLVRGGPDVTKSRPDLGGLSDDQQDIVYALNASI